MYIFWLALVWLVLACVNCWPWLFTGSSWR
jgi:hypothetical protein